MTRDELIAALEASTAPSRELDVAIAHAIGWRTLGDAEKAAQQQYMGWNWFTPEDEPKGLIDAWRYTASIDAALTLVPEGFGFSVDKWSPVADIWEHLGRVWPAASPDDATHGNGVTPAIALCIAALKARTETGR